MSTTGIIRRHDPTLEVLIPAPPLSVDRSGDVYVADTSRKENFFLDISVAVVDCPCSR